MLKLKGDRMTEKNIVQINLQAKQNKKQIKHINL